MEKELFNYYKNALTDNLCQEYKGYWQAAGEDGNKLLKLALSQQAIPHWMTYAYQGKGVTKDYILQKWGNFVRIDDADNVKGYTYALYTAFEGICTPSDDVSAFVWSTIPQVTINATKCPILYVGCNSDLTITLEGYNNLIVYLFDESVIRIEDADPTSSIYVYKYSRNARVEKGKYCICDKFKVFEKDLRL